MSQVPQAWSWVLMAVGLTGLWLGSGGHRVGWAIGLFAQLLWLTYGVVTGQLGFLVSAVAYGIVNARALVRTPRRGHEDVVATEPG
jgi:hypothetical protein